MAEFAQMLAEFKNAVHRLQGKAQLKETLDKVEDLQGEVQGLATNLKHMRERGYVFHKTWEAEVTALEKQWQMLQPTLNARVQEQSRALQAALRPLESRLEQVQARLANPSAAQTLLNGSQALVETFEKKVEAAADAISGMYDAFESQLDDLVERFEAVEWMLTQLAEASFSLLPEESGLMAVKAVWCAENQERAEDPDGVLYLTDQRLIFEQKEEVATRKLLFITTAKKKVQQQVWALPVSLLESVQTRKLGLLRNEDYLDLRFAPAAERQSLCLHIWQPAENWQALLNQAKAHAFDSTRVKPLSAAARTTQHIPTECPRCGGQLPQTVLRGQQSLTCPYCGSVIRL